MNEYIISIVNEIVSLVNPLKIILVSKKYNPAKQLTGFKLCVIIDDGDTVEIERKIYLNVDSDVSYDLIVYNHEFFCETSKQHDSFAHKINSVGCVVYE